MLDHVAIQCTDMAASAAFFDAVLAPLGARRLMDFGVTIGYGVPPQPDFWIGEFNSGEGFREPHVAFTAPDRATVRAFFDAAVGSGAEVLHEPRLWPEYHNAFYGAFVRDPDGNNIEVVCHVPTVLTTGRGRLPTGTTPYGQPRHPVTSMAITSPGGGVRGTLSTVCHHPGDAVEAYPPQR